MSGGLDLATFDFRDPHQLSQALKDHGLREVARLRGVHHTTLMEWRDKLLADQPIDSATALLDYLKARAIPTGVRPIVNRQGKQYLTELIGCDLQYPFHHEAAWEVFLGACEKLSPEGVTLNGDTWDFHYLSRYRKDPRVRADIQADIDEVREKILARVNTAAPDSRRTITLGNHDWVRWETYLFDRCPEIVKLRVLENFGALLGIEEMGWTLAKDGYWLIPDVFHIYHGTRVTNTLGGGSGQSAKKEAQDFGACSGVSGHTHRLGSFYRKDPAGFRVWKEGGCLCDQAKMRQAGVTTHKYGVREEDWHLGFVRVDYAADGESFFVSEIPILESKGKTFCIVDDEEIVA